MGIILEGNMDKIITIGRQFGSAGHEIGEKLAERLNIKYYDKELLALAAKNSGLCEEIFETHDEKPTSSFLYNLVVDTYTFGYNSTSFTDMPISHKVFLAQFDAIKKLAEEGPCVIVGRCADYALMDNKNLVSIFISGDIDSKMERIIAKYNITADKAKAMIQKGDKKRAAYYNYYSSKKWGVCDSYDLCVNSSKLGIEGTTDLLYNYITSLK